jgi:purine-binding chemotaxis protein CheW
MSTSLAVANNNTALAVSSQNELLTVMLGDQMFGIPILQVQDVLKEQKVTRIPLAPPEIVGSLNLRGRVVTAIRVQECLGLTSDPNSPSQNMSIVVEFEGEFYSLIFDRVGDVLQLSLDDYETNPSTLDTKLRAISDGIYRLSDKLLVVINIPKLLQGIGTSHLTA